MIFMALLAMAVFFSGRDESHAPASEMVLEIGNSHEQSPGVSSDPISLERESEAPPSEAATPAANVPDPSVAELENTFRRIREPKTRVAFAKQIAGFNDAAAVQSIARLFQKEPSPVVQEALLSALSDIDAQENPEVRLGVLADGLRRSARNVRLTALHSLESIEETQVTELLREASRSDPDREVREVAAELLRERLEETAP